MRGILRYVSLPAFVTPFERAYLARVNRVGLGVLLAHLPVITAIAWWNDTGWLHAAELCVAALVGPLVAHRWLPERPRLVSSVCAVAAMLLGGVLVHVGEGPMQIEMHFHFFVILASLAVFGNPRVVLVGATTVALHHAALWWLFPASVFNYDAAGTVVAIHALFIGLLSVSACFISRLFFDNVIGLTRKVEQRTRDLEARHRDIRLLLDNLGQGFLTLAASGALGAERSQILERWFGPHAMSAPRWIDLLMKMDADFAARTALGWEAVVDDFMPIELTLSQMPRKLEVDERHFTVEYRRIGGSGADIQVLVVVDEVTDVVWQEQANRARSEDLQLLEGLLKDPTGTWAFFEEAESTMRALENHRLDPEELKRALHTLKGNAGVAGFHALASTAHQVEQRYADAGALRDEDLLPLLEQFRNVAARAARLRGDQRATFDLDPARLDALEHAVRVGASPEVVAQRVRELRRDPARHRLERLAEHAQRIAETLGKGPIATTIDADEVFVDPERWRPIWAALVHAVRNALDHGLEAEDERVAAAKTTRGSLWLRAAELADKTVIEVEDDGRGVDLVALAAKATAAGLPTGTEAQILEALWADGVSTAEAVSELSGRGVGMSALRAAVRAAGGDARIETVRGAGTKVRIEVPHHEVEAAVPRLKVCGSGAVPRIARTATLTAGDVV